MSRWVKSVWRTIRPRRWLRYRLRTLLVLVTLVALSFGVITTRTQRQLRLVKDIRDAGGVVVTDVRGPEWLRGILGDEHFVCVSKVHLTNEMVGDQVLQRLRDLRGLERLVVGGETGGFPPGLRNSGRISVDPSGYNNAVTDAGLRHLQSLRDLRWLFLIGCNHVSDAGFGNVRGLRQLELLNVCNCPITDAGLRSLYGMPHLKRLRLEGTRVTDAGVARLQEMLPNLRVERITATPPTLPLPRSFLMPRAAAARTSGSSFSSNVERR